MSSVVFVQMFTRPCGSHYDYSAMKYGQMNIQVDGQTDTTLFPSKSCCYWTKMPDFISMGLCKKDGTPVRQQWSYIFLALSHRYLQTNISKLFYMEKCYMKSKRDDITHPGGRLNKKDGLTRYGDSHVKDMTS